MNVTRLHAIKQKVKYSCAVERFLFCEYTENRNIRAGEDLPTEFVQ
jgi:hypothetical protein